MNVKTTSSLKSTQRTMSTKGSVDDAKIINSKLCKKSDSKICDLVCHWLDQDKAENIIAIDIRGKSPFADWMIVATGTSNRHISAMAEHLHVYLKQQGLDTMVDGLEQSDWVLIDTNDVVVHLFREEVRRYYNLESMWLTELDDTELDDNLIAKNVNED